MLLGAQNIREVSLFQRLICTQEYTIGTSETVLIREVSLFQRLICIQEYAIGSSETVLIREVSLFQRLMICTLYTKVCYWEFRNCSDYRDPFLRGVLYY